MPFEEGKSGNPLGRPKGAVNKSTLIREALKGNFEDLLQKKGQKLFEAVVDKAIDGDMTAAKLVLDRILPTSKAIDLSDLEKSKGLSIQINVGSMKQPETIDAEIVDAEVIDVQSESN